MKLIVQQEAKEDLSELDSPIQEQLIEEIESLQQNPIPDNSVYIEVGNMQLFRLKVQEEDRNSDLNHRIFYQIEDDKIYVRGVFHRQKGYGTKTAEELRDRV